MQEEPMPEKEVKQRAEKDLREGKSASTAAGEFVREEIEHVREGKHGARSPEQAIAIGPNTMQRESKNSTSRAALSEHAKSTAHKRRARP
jgi:hypothetical protein